MEPRGTPTFGLGTHRLEWGTSNPVMLHDADLGIVRTDRSASAIERADRVVMVELGSVVERGTHAELIAAGGRYATMHRSGTTS